MDITIACPCPGTPHPGGDTITLRDKPTLHMGATAMGWVAAGQGRPPTAGDIAELYVREGVIAWTLTDEEGEPRLLDDGGIQVLLDDWASAWPVADAAAALYSDAIFQLPLRVTPKREKSSRGGSTGKSTSATSQPSPEAPSP